MNEAYTLIEFESLSATLRGHLYRKDSNAQNVIIVMAHGFTSTIHNMTADKYAERFQDHGYDVLLYDHRNFGISDGEPRQEVNFWVQSRGYIDAIDFIKTRVEFTGHRIVVWGTSMSAGEAFLVGCVDDRVDAVLTMVPAFGDDHPIESHSDLMYKFAKDTLFKKDILQLSYPTTSTVPVVSDDQSSAPSRLKELSAHSWFTEYGRRLDTRWKNEVSKAEIDTPEGFHLGHCAPYLSVPVFFIIARDDEIKGANADISLAVYQMVPGAKGKMVTDGGHFGPLYYPGDIFERSVNAQIDFLKRKLNKEDHS